MKHRLAAFILSAFLALAPGMTHAVELTPECEFVYGNSGFDAQAVQLLFLLGNLVPGLPESYKDADLESVAGELDGDGIPDWYQLGMLGAVLCGAPDKDAGAIRQQFEANLSVFSGMISDIDSLVAAMEPVVSLNPPGQIVVVASAIQADTANWVTPPGDLEGVPASANSFADLLLASAEGIDGFLTDYGDVLTSALPVYASLFVGMAGLSTEMQTTIHGFVDDAFMYLIDVKAELTSGALFLWNPTFSVATFDFGNPLTWPGVGQYDQVGITGIDAGLLGPTGSCAALSAELLAAAPLLSIELPVFEVYGANKTASEPFSALGDYNGDGMSNLDTYSGVVDAVGSPDSDATRALFVSAATGSSPFWPGNPGLPAAGLLGMALLTSAIAALGALSSRSR